jgi:hypothetical protein
MPFKIPKDQPVMRSKTRYNDDTKKIVETYHHRVANRDLEVALGCKKEDKKPEKLKVQTIGSRLAEQLEPCKIRFQEFSIVKDPADPVVIADMEKRTDPIPSTDPMYAAMDEAYDAMAEADKENRAEHACNMGVDGSDNSSDNAIEALYQDQRNYPKREACRALKALAERQAREPRKVEFRPDDCRGQDERRQTVATLKSYRSHVLTMEGLATEKIQFLDRYGWGDVSQEEEKTLRESVAEFRAFLKQWNKKYKIKK